MSNIGRIIKDFYCNGFGGRRYDLAGSVIEAEGKDYIVVRTDKDEPVFMDFLIYDKGVPIGVASNKQEYIDNWVSGKGDEGY